VLLALLDGHLARRVQAVVDDRRRVEQADVTGPELVVGARAGEAQGQLVVEGANAAPGIFVSVESTTSAAAKRSDTSGRFKVATSGSPRPTAMSSSSTARRRPRR
jgi:hypothetical protein